MRNYSDQLMVDMGELIKRVRSQNMDQTELGKRVGLSRTSISAIERGKGVNSRALFDVLAFLGLLDPLQQAIDEQLQAVYDNPVRKQRKERPELSNDF